MQVVSESDHRVIAALHDAMTRLLTFAEIHAQLKDAPGQEIDLLEMLRRLTEAVRNAFSGVNVALALHGEPSPYPSPAATTLALVANELITNAIKYGAPADDGKLHVDISVTHAEDRFGCASGTPATRSPRTSTPSAKRAWASASSGTPSPAATMASSPSAPKPTAPSPK